MNRIVKLVILCIVAFTAVVSGLTACKPSFEEQRVKAVDYLKQVNQADNNFSDAVAAADIGGKLNRGNVLEINSALNTLVQLAEGYQQRVNEISAPSSIPELVELNSVNQKSVTKSVQVIQQLRSAVQMGNTALAQQAVIQLTLLSTDPDYKKFREIQESVLAKYNIPDTEVSYRQREAK